MLRMTQSKIRNTSLNVIAIHKGTVWDQKQQKYVGCIDYGTGIPEPGDSLATKALVFLAAGVHSSRQILDTFFNANVQQ